MINKGKPHKTRSIHNGELKSTKPMVLEMGVKLRWNGKENRIAEIKDKKRIKMFSKTFLNLV